MVLLLLLSGNMPGQSTSDITIRPIRPEGKCPNGALDLIISGGVATYEVDWYWEVRGASYLIESNDGLSANSGVEDLEGLLPGVYRVVITDAACGQIEETIELFQGLFSDGSDRIITERQNVSECSRDSTGMTITSDGSITLLEVLGLNLPYQVVWNGPGVVNVIGNSITGLGPGTYTVIIKTVDGCELKKEITLCCCGSGVKSENKSDQCGNQDLIFPLSIEQELLYSPDNRNSFNGQLSIRVKGGTESENSISWVGPNGYTSTATQLYNLGVGKYCVKANDGCTKVERCFELVDCSEKPLQLFSAIRNTCRSRIGQDIDAGIINLQLEGGWPPFTYRWNDGSADPVRNNLSAGVYCVTVSDSKGCRPESACFTIGYNQMTPMAANDERCGQVWLCNGQEYTPDFQPVATYWEYDDLNDCRIRHEYCPFDNPDRRLPTPAKTDPLSNLRWDDRSCDIIGDCPDGSGNTRVAAHGNQRRLFTVFLVRNSKCPGNALCPVCFRADVCEAFLNGERFVRPIDREWIQTSETASSEEFPGICEGRCVLTCFGQAATRPDLSEDFCATCPVQGLLNTDGNYKGIPELILGELTVADYIIMDYQQGNDIFNTTYTFPGEANLLTKISTLPLWENRRSEETNIKGFTLNDLLKTSQEYDDLIFEDESWKKSISSFPLPNIYPNPGFGIIDVSTETSPELPYKDTNVDIFDLDGKVVFSQKIWIGKEPVRIDLRTLKSGVFIVRLSHPAFGQVTERLIIIN